MKTNNFFVSILFAIFLFSSILSAQEFGKIFDRLEADKLYGKVFQTEEFSKT